MNVPLEYLLFGGSVLLLLSILASKVSSRLGIPALLLFLAVGMLAGSEGPGGIHFDDPRLVQSAGVIALAAILFSGGMDTDWRSVRPVLRAGIALSTLGVCLTALLMGWFAHAVLGFGWLEGLLLGSIVSSTDAAAVFAVLRSRNIRLKDDMKSLLELESGSNDPMAVLLTIAITTLVVEGQSRMGILVPTVAWQMGFGAFYGYAVGRGAVHLINRLRLEHEGLYSVLTLALIPFTYGSSTLLQGNGFLSVYVAGIVIGNSRLVQKRSLMRFHDGLAWLMQIVMFLILGLQVFPSHLLPVIPEGLLCAAFLMVAARPLSVFGGLLFSRLTMREKAMVSWVGLRGAVPIILATFPLLAGVGQAETFFNIVFFIVLTSALLQGTTIPALARLLGLEERHPPRSHLHGVVPDDMTGEMLEVVIGGNSPATGRQIVDLRLPTGALIVYIRRDWEYLIPGGGTVLEENDRVFLLAAAETAPLVRSLLEGGAERSGDGSLLDR
ncbi:potassium/proton antiporter [Geobacter sp. DSM 9736]|uniref:potassium/proton antiporter n=1 Tax=Geobacter sp. DSM 9736 TaxID=1277350 RepID=UPI000B513ECB|nr:potassium/proton antiporter [Geobacter sp. DSM 9736]SNB46878.1 potassium/proton antiporter, CPA1 family [Geobacter sp. DSM 9736]